MNPEYITLKIGQHRRVQANAIGLIEHADPGDMYCQNLRMNIYGEVIYFNIHWCSEWPQSVRNEWRISQIKNERTGELLWVMSA